MLGSWSAGSRSRWRGPESSGGRLGSLGLFLGLALAGTGPAVAKPGPMGDPGWPFRLVPPAGFQFEVTAEGGYLQSPQVPGALLVIPHPIANPAELAGAMGQGLHAGGVPLVPKGALASGADGMVEGDFEVAGTGGHMVTRVFVKTVGPAGGAVVVAMPEGPRPEARLLAAAKAVLASLTPATPGAAGSSAAAVPAGTVPRGVPPTGSAPGGTPGWADEDDGDGADEGEEPAGNWGGTMPGGAWGGPPAGGAWGGAPAGSAPGNWGGAPGGWGGQSEGGAWGGAPGGSPGRFGGGSPGGPGAGQPGGPSGDTSFLVGTWTTSTANSQTTYTLYPNGTWSSGREAAYTGQFSNQYGVNTGNWGVANDSSASGRWSAQGDRQQGVLTLQFPSGEVEQIPYQVHVEKGQVYWNEYKFDGVHYAKTR